jgi:hypothetical protein
VRSSKTRVYYRTGYYPVWRGRTHFFAVAATTLRRILIDHARAHRTERRGGNEIKVPLHLAEAGAPCSYDDLIEIDRALTQLEQADERAARWGGAMPGPVNLLSSLYFLTGRLLRS